MMIPMKALVMLDVVTLAAVLVVDHVAALMIDLAAAPVVDLPAVLVGDLANWRKVAEKDLERVVATLLMEKTHRFGASVRTSQTTSKIHYSEGFLGCPNEDSPSPAYFA